LTAVEGSRYVILAGMLGAVGGGFWAELAYERFIAPTGTRLDLMALLVAGTLTLVIAWMVWRAGGRAALLAYLVVAGVSATLGPALLF
jgi:hypothetical protein